MDLDDEDDDHLILALVHDPLAHTLALLSLPLPLPLGPDEHLIQVHAVALTNGELAWSRPATAAPPVPGYEVSGTVLLAPATSPFQPGTEVYALTDFARPGNARELTVARTAELGQKPENLCWEEAATVPLSALTAWQALFVHGGLVLPQTSFSSSSSSAPFSTTCRLRSRFPRSLVADGSPNAAKRVLITAAAGGVGLWAVQLARLAGVGHITATCGPANTGFVRSLGAHRVVDYTAPTRSCPSGKYDLVLDCVGGETLRRAWTRARHGGTVLSIAMPADRLRPDAGVGMDVRSAWFVVQANSRQLQAVTHLVEAGMARAAFDSAFPLEQYEAAFARAYSGHLRGKVVLRLA